MSASAPARAAPAAPVAIDRAATDGVDRPYKDYSGEGDASSIELNPALLQATPGIDVTGLGYRSVSPYTRGTGLGGFVSLNLGLGFATGLGVQVVRPGFTGGNFDFDAAHNPDITKISWALSGGDGKVAAIGVGIHGVRQSGQWLRRPDLDLGVLFRVRNWASVGANARFGPVDLVDATLPPELNIVGELAIRPLGTRAVELGGGVRARFAADPVAEPLMTLSTLGVLPRGRIALRWQGIELLGEIEQVRAAVLDPQSKSLVSPAKALRGSIAIGLAWDLLHIRTGVHTGLSGAVDGVGGAVRFSTARQGRVYWPRSVNAERLKIGEVSDERSLIAMLEAIDRAEKAGPRSILVIEPGATKLGWAGLQELRQALIRVRDAGGHVFAYVEDASLRAYYLASVAEKVYIHPAGELSIFGLKATTLYYKGALDKLGVAVQALHIDEYKSAHEPFTRTDRSAADKAQREAYLAATYDQIIHDIAQAREIGRADVMSLIDDAPLGPERATQARLADRVVFRDELLPAISDEVGARVGFAQFTDTAPARPTWSDRPYIAVVLIEGTIIDGKSRHIPFLDLHFTGGDTIVDTLRELRGDPACVGVVLRINSPGGSALASDVIWREVARTQAAFDKAPRDNPPIVVSMTDVAASGGYYVAVGAKPIFAQPTTLTGSIGVVSLHFDISGLLGKLGVREDTLTKGHNADIGGIYRPYTADQQARMLTSMTRIYDLFRARVADGRGLTAERVHELGRGHVYAGGEARALGLVDEFGGLHEAIAWIHAHGRVPRTQPVILRVLPTQRTLVDLVLSLIGVPIKRRDRAAVDEGHARRGLLDKAAADAIPLALSRALARVPLSLLFLPQDRANALMPGLVQFDDR